MHKIYYDIKQTTANTQYLSLSEQDTTVINNNILGILAYMCELSIAKDKDINDAFVHWFHKSSKRFLYNSKLKRNNSPQTLLAGCINNIAFGDQYDFSLVQLETLQDIINTSIDIIQAIELAKSIKLQQKSQLSKIFIQENLWVM
jgi:hypothetical protein